MCFRTIPLHSIACVNALPPCFVDSPLIIILKLGAMIFGYLMDVLFDLLCLVLTSELQDSGKSSLCVRVSLLVTSITTITHITTHHPVVYLCLLDYHKLSTIYKYI